MHADTEGEYKARRYQRLLGFPATNSFKTYINNNFLFNCNITVNYIDRAEHINKEAKPTLYGKMRRKKPTVQSKIEKNTFTSSNIRETKNPTSIHGHFLCKWFDILTH